MAQNTQLVGSELIDKLIPAGDKNIATIQFGQKYYPYLSDHVITSSPVTIDWGYGPTNYVGYYKDFDWVPGLVPTPGPADIGSIDNVGLLGSDIEITGVTLSDNTTNSSTLPDYMFQILIRGSHQPQDVIELIEVEHAGILDTATPIAYAPHAASNGMTQWWWGLSKAQHDAIVASGEINLRIKTPAWHDSSIRQIILAELDAGATMRTSFREYSHRIDYDASWASLGAMTDISLSGNKIAGLSFKHTVGGQTSDDDVAITVLTPDLPDSTFGAIRLAGLNWLTPSTVVEKRNSMANTGPETMWRWNLAERSKWGDVKTRASIPLGAQEIEIDERSFILDRTMTCAQFNVSNQEWKGFAEFRSGTQPTLGSATTQVAPNTNSLFALFVYKLDSNINYNLTMRFDGNDIPKDQFEYVEIEGLGRFYSEDCGVFNPPPEHGYTQFHWSISSEAYNAFPSSGTREVQII